MPFIVHIHKTNTSYPLGIGSTEAIIISNKSENELRDEWAEEEYTLEFYHFIHNHGQLSDKLPLDESLIREFNSATSG